MNVLSRGLKVALCLGALLVPASSALGATVKIRIEGETRTLLTERQVTIPDGGPIPGASADCTWDEPAGALEFSTAGNWDRTNFVQTIMGETASSSTGWFIWVSGKYSGGNCFDQIHDGDSVLFTKGAYDADFNPVDLPMTVRDVPARIAPGRPFTVSVDEVKPDLATDPQYGNQYYVPGSGTARPAQGATVVAAGATATVGADGKATITVSQSGPLTVQATRGDRASRSRPVETCSTTGSDGACGTTVPTPQAAPARDLTPPLATIASIRDRRVFSRAQAPRVLRGTVAEAGGVLMVKARLTRTSGGRCTAYSASRERFVRRPRCGAEQGWWFKVGDRTDWEYQLARKLPKGRYVLDVKAIDQAYNRDEQRRRGQNRVLFEVR